MSDWNMMLVLNIAEIKPPNRSALLSYPDQDYCHHFAEQKEKDMN